MPGFTSSEYGRMEWAKQPQEMKDYIREAKRKLEKFGVHLTEKGIVKLVNLKTKEKVDEFVETTKKKYMKKYIEYKVQILKDFAIKVTEEHIKYMRSLSSPIYVDNYAQDLIRKIQR